MERLVLRGTSQEHLLADLHQCELLGDHRTRTALRGLAERPHRTLAPRRSLLGRLLRRVSAG